MSSSQLAVIDLGTNTFHLLIVRQQHADGWTETYRERRFIKLAENGIETIGAAPLQRGIDALTAYRKKMDELGVTNYRAIGTAALRTATNGAIFLQAAKEKAGIDIEIIDGDEEARLIGLGVLSALTPLQKEERVLIMDIGGGSVEFIISGSEETGILWAASFPVGVAVLRGEFHREEPMSAVERRTLLQHLTEMLRPLFMALQKWPTHHLVGAAGIFDVAAVFLGQKGKLNATNRTINLVELDRFYEQCKNTTLAQRMAIPELPEARADMMVVTLELIRYVVKEANIDLLTVSGYSLKEGALLEMLTPSSGS